MPPRPLARLRKLCLALPEAHEQLAWGEPTFRVGKKLFAMYADGGNHHGAGRDSAWIKSTIARQELLLRLAPDRFFKPAYVGPSGWIGVWLDGPADWDEVKDLLRDAYCMIAPKRLVAQLEK